MTRRWTLFRGRRKVNLWDDTLPDERQVKMCFGKRMMNKQQALQTTAHMRKHHGASGSLGPYKCRVCKHYHVGNDNRWKDVA